MDVGATLRLPLMFAVLLLGACASTPKIYTQEDPGADFSSYRTFAFENTLGTDRAGGGRSLESQHLVAAARSQMEQRGYRYDADNPDVRLNFYLATEEKTKVRQVPRPSVGVGFYARKIANIRMRGTAAKLNLALDGVPDFTGLDRKALGGRLVIAPSIDYVERAFNPVKYGQYGAEPAMEITIPSLHDPGLAPEGRHVLSAVGAPPGRCSSRGASRSQSAPRSTRTTAASGTPRPSWSSARTTARRR